MLLGYWLLKILLCGKAIETIHLLRLERIRGILVVGRFLLLLSHSLFSQLLLCQALVVVVLAALLLNLLALRRLQGWLTGLRLLLLHIGEEIVLHWLGLLLWLNDRLLYLQCLLIECYLGDIAVLTRQHQFSFLLGLFLSARIVGPSWGTIFFELFDSVAVAESIQSVLTTGRGWRHIGDHGCFTIASEWVLENLSQFTTSKRQVFFL